VTQPPTFMPALSEGATDTCRSLWDNLGKGGKIESVPRSGDVADADVVSLPALLKKPRKLASVSVEAR